MGIFNTNMPKEGEIIHGKYGEYVLCNELGHGGNGFVFDIRIIENNYSVYQSTQRYVIKILILKKTRRTDEKEKRRIRFQREITAVRQVGNQKLDILPILDSYLDVANSRYEWYVMPKAKECKYLWHIESIIKLKYLRELGETLSKLHKMGVYHRDIKPENILFYNNRLCLSDFGLVWTIQEDNHITGNLEAVGPARIRPPEMEYNIEKVKEDIDFQKVDAYLFVKTIWIILTGNRNGFRGEYNRADFRIYLNKNHLKLGRTVEPLHGNGYEKHVSGNMNMFEKDLLQCKIGAPIIKKDDLKLIITLLKYMNVQVKKENDEQNAIDLILAEYKDISDDIVIDDTVDIGWPPAMVVVTDSLLYTSQVFQRYGEIEPHRRPKVRS